MQMDLHDGPGSGRGRGRGGGYQGRNFQPDYQPGRSSRGGRGGRGGYNGGGGRFNTQNQNWNQQGGGERGGRMGRGYWGNDQKGEKLLTCSCNAHAACCGWSTASSLTAWAPACATSCSSCLTCTVSYQAQHRLLRRRDPVEISSSLGAPDHVSPSKYGARDALSVARRPAHDASRRAMAGAALTAGDVPHAGGGGRGRGRGRGRAAAKFNDPEDIQFVRSLKGHTDSVTCAALDLALDQVSN